MKTKKIYSQRTIHERQMIEEINHDISLTVPNQAPPLKNILRSLANGNSLKVGKSVYYDDPTTEDPDPMIRQIDVTEVYDLLAKTNEKLALAAKELQDKKAEKLKSQTDNANDTKEVAKTVSDEVTAETSK